MWRFPSIEVPQNHVLQYYSGLILNELGVPLFQETYIYIYISMVFGRHIVLLDATIKINTSIEYYWSILKYKIVS